MTHTYSTPQEFRVYYASDLVTTVFDFSAYGAIKQIMEMSYEFMDVTAVRIATDKGWQDVQMPRYEAIGRRK
jgi:hypothetical protein